jgi:hypothetical protein
MPVEKLERTVVCKKVTCAKCGAWDVTLFRDKDNYGKKVKPAVYHCARCK